MICKTCTNPNPNLLLLLTTITIIIVVITLIFIIMSHVAVQDLLTNPNPNSPAQREAYEIYTTNLTEYSKRIREQARRNPPRS